MSMSELIALRPMIDDIAHDDSCWLLWSLNSMPGCALDLMRAWGFRFSTTCFTWIKTNRDGSPFKGCGYWSRQNSERVLLGVRGRPIRLARDVGEVILAPRREHSRKPDEFYRAVERLLPGPRIDLFSRESRPGWDCWGNEVSKFDLIQERTANAA
jgi:N6-adenosine-specific RNA methylase IME4